MNDYGAPMEYAELDEYRAGIAKKVRAGKTITTEERAVLLEWHSESAILGAENRANELTAEEALLSYGAADASEAPSFYGPADTGIGMNETVLQAELKQAHISHINALEADGFEVILQKGKGKKVFWQTAPAGGATVEPSLDPAGSNAANAETPITTEQVDKYLLLEKERLTDAALETTNMSRTEIVESLSVLFAEKFEPELRMNLAKNIAAGRAREAAVVAEEGLAKIHIHVDDLPSW